MLYLLGVAYSVDSVSNLSDPFNNGGETYFSIMRETGGLTSLYLVQTQDGIAFTGYPVQGQQFARLISTPRTVSVLNGATGTNYYFTQYDEMDEGSAADHVNHMKFTSSGTLNPATTPVIITTSYSPVLPNTGEFITKVFHFSDGSGNRYFLTGNLSTAPYALYFGADPFTTVNEITFSVGGVPTPFRDANNPCDRVYMAGGTIACGFWSGATASSILNPASGPPAGALGHEIMGLEELATTFVAPVLTSGAPNYTLDFYFGGTYFPGSLFAGAERPISLGYADPRKFKMSGDGSSDVITFLADFCGNNGCGTHLVFLSSLSNSLDSPPATFGPIFDINAFENGKLLSNSKLGTLPTKAQFLYLEKGLLGAQKLMMLTFDIASAKLTGPTEVIINYLP
ncbi:hypothetical protein CH373_03435 [Leptospira perolatii]|uniref:Uncharacterized protein n=2 Tax=Leptospira perolatii TaxID=2023191 RepID=A0A2M9ZSX1_9LEPT|nr:hypothetical protein CH360_14315 [Leptospira perolatii]PJZ75081.1 hypothetical protein CH373_03435 [Leptospira perolatii]